MSSLPHALPAEILVMQHLASPGHLSVQQNVFDPNTPTMALDAYLQTLWVNSSWRLLTESAVAEQWLEQTIKRHIVGLHPLCQLPFDHWPYQMTYLEHDGTDIWLYTYHFIPQREQLLLTLQTKTLPNESTEKSLNKESADGLLPSEIVPHLQGVLMQVITRHQKERQMTWDIDLPSEQICLSDADQQNLPPIFDQLLEALHILRYEQQSRVRVRVQRVTREHLPQSLQYHFQTQECVRLQWNLFLEASGNSPPRISHTGQSLKTLRLIRIKQAVERAGGRLEIEEFRPHSLQIGIYLGGVSAG